MSAAGQAQPCSDPRPCSMGAFARGLAFATKREAARRIPMLSSSNARPEDRMTTIGIVARGLLAVQDVRQRCGADFEARCVLEAAQKGLYPGGAVLIAALRTMVPLERARLGRLPLPFPWPPLAAPRAGLPRQPCFAVVALRSRIGYLARLLFWPSARMPQDARVARGALEDASQVPTLRAKGARALADPRRTALAQRSSCSRWLLGHAGCFYKRSEQQRWRFERSTQA
jgi:hypothetical protein